MHAYTRNWSSSGPRARHKKSIWILRRIGVVLDAVQMGEVAVLKINRSFNVADIFTRYNTYDTWIRFMHYIENYFATLPDTVDDA